MRFFDKNLKSNYYKGSEKLIDISNQDSIYKMHRFLATYYGALVNSIPNPSASLNKIFYVHYGYETYEIFESIETHTNLKDFYFIVENMAIYISTHFNDHLKDFTEELNDMFIIEKIPLQLISHHKTKSIFMEKVINESHSKEIIKTLDNFEHYDKIHKDFKKAIIAYSSGDYKGTYEKSCIAIEDYLCIILEKESCSSIDSEYKAIVKKLGIPQDIDERFKPMISYIHKYRSKPIHGAIKEHAPENPKLIGQVIIGFTMTILNYLHYLYEKK